jgi:hypothetical protein
MIRPLDKLRRDQAAILDSFREESAARGSVAVLPRPGGALNLAVYGRISDVVTSDATYGPHLVVVRQRWSGTPPTPGDVAESSVRCYPSPGRAVGDYAEDEYVRILAAHGAMVAEKLA